MVISFAIAIFAAGEDDFATDDIGDAFEKLSAVAQYADQRLEAAAESAPIPETPRILADQRDLRFTLVLTGVSQLFVAALVILVARQGVGGFFRSVRMDEIHPLRWWLILGTVTAAYLGTFLYSIAATATGISWLEPQSTVPPGVTRETSTLVITALVTLVGAPISEEMFFRGLIFGGLARWGFWPAALVAGTMFSLVHFDPGSFIPFVGIGMLICWVYWRRKSLWDAVAFHFMFNALSFAFMVALS
jgi:membrane protease YdiL (CAAX protease family)